MSSAPKAHDNRQVQAFLEPYLSAHELCVDHPAIDDILSGVLELRTAGDTATRALSRKALFRVLQWCHTIDVTEVDAATNGQYAYRTVASYAASARVASKGIASYLDRMTPGRIHGPTIKQERMRLDAPFSFAT